MGLYPGVVLEESGLLERVAQIRDEAFGKRVRERMLPSQEVLAQRLFSQSQELADVRKHLQRYHGLVLELQRRIREFGAQDPDDAAWLEMERQVTQGLAKALATESVDFLEVLDDMLKVMTSHVTVRPSSRSAAASRLGLPQPGRTYGMVAVCTLPCRCSDSPRRHSKSAFVGWDSIEIDQWIAERLNNRT